MAQFPNTTSASDIWSLRDIYKAVAGDKWPEVSLPVDPNFVSVSLLLNGDGANGSTTFTDLSNNALTVSAQGNAQVSTSVFKYGTGSMAFDGSGDRLQISNNSLLDLGTGDFTIECWVYSTTPLGDYTLDYAHIAGKGSGNSSGTYALGFYQSNIYFAVAGSNDGQGATTLTNNTWYHFAATRESGTLRLFVNGVLDYSGSLPDQLNSSESFNIGDRKESDPTANYPMAGYVDDLRVTKGVARYTATFTPPTDAFPTE